MCGCSCVPPTGDLARNPGMCPDLELNQRPFDSQASTQSTELHQPGPMCILSVTFIVLVSQFIIDFWSLLLAPHSEGKTHLCVSPLFSVTYNNTTSLMTRCVGFTHQPIL